MESMGGIHIIGRKCQVEFIFAQIIRFFSIFEPGQFQAVRRSSVTKENQNKTAILCFNSSCFFQLQRIPVKRQAFFQIQHIKVIVSHCKFHPSIPLAY